MERRAVFERICRSREYYLARTEIQILRENAGTMAEFFGEQTSLFEFGSGSGIKIRLLLRHLPGLKGYIPIDISHEVLVRPAAPMS